MEIFDKSLMFSISCTEAPSRMKFFVRITSFSVHIAIIYDKVRTPLFSKEQQ